MHPVYSPQYLGDNLTIYQPYYLSSWGHRKWLRRDKKKQTFALETILAAFVGAPTMAAVAFA